MAKSKKRARLLVFLEETKNQLKKVTWLSRQEARQMTLTVIGVSLAMAAFIGALDFGFTKLVGLLVK